MFTPQIHTRLYTPPCSRLQPIIWKGTTLDAVAGSPNVFKATPPKPLLKGRWTGYYIEIFFPSELQKSEYQLTTPGYVWTDTLPHEACDDFAKCVVKLV